MQPHTQGPLARRVGHRRGLLWEGGDVLLWVFLINIIVIPLFFVKMEKERKLRDWKIVHQIQRFWALPLGSVMVY